MHCPECSSIRIRKNSSTKGKHRYICANCQQQFLSVYEQPKGYSNHIKRECLELNLNGMGFRAIEPVKHVHHKTIIHWVKQLGQCLPDLPPDSHIPEVGELDELQTFVHSKKTKFWLWSAVNHFRPGILAWVLGDRCAETFKPL